MSESTVKDEVRVVTARQSQALNRAIGRLEGEFADQQAAFARLLTVDESGKPIFYFGWYWREVDFTADRITLAIDSAGRVGFCENNKWGYRQWSVKGAERARLIDLLRMAVKSLTNDDIRAVNAYMRELGKPHFGKGYYDS